MRIRVSSTVAAAAILGLFVAASVLVAGQSVQQGGGGQQTAPVAGPMPRLPNGKPDLNGLWQNPFVTNMAAKGTVLDPRTRQPLVFPRLGEPLPDAAPNATGTATRTFDLPYTEWGLQQWKTYDPIKNGDYAGSCLPFGLSRNINAPHGLQMIQNSDALAFLFEQNTWHHWVPTNGMKWPSDLPLTWSGLSTGRWEGDTLVVETSWFNGYTRLDTTGHPHSKELKLTNTFLRRDSRTIEHTVTVHDPRTYTRDWMNVRTWKIRDAPDVIMEYSCEENNTGLLDGSIKPWKIPEEEP